MKRTSILILSGLLAAGLSACKTSREPDFGIPDDDHGLFSRERRDERADNWHKKRADWAKREDEKWDRIFDRAKGEF